MTIFEALGELVDAAIEWRHADENDDADEADRLTDAVDAYEEAKRND